MNNTGIDDGELSVKDQILILQVIRDTASFGKNNDDDDDFIGVGLNGVEDKIIPVTLERLNSSLSLLLGGGRPPIEKEKLSSFLHKVYKLPPLKSEPAQVTLDEDNERGGEQESSRQPPPPIETILDNDNKTIEKPPPKRRGRPPRKPKEPIMVMEVATSSLEVPPPITPSFEPPIVKEPELGLGLGLGLSPVKRPRRTPARR